MKSKLLTDMHKGAEMETESADRDWQSADRMRHVLIQYPEGVDMAAKVQTHTVCPNS